MKDDKLDHAVTSDMRWRITARVVREVLNQPDQCICVNYLDNRRERMGLRVIVYTFLAQNPFLFETYRDRIKPTSNLIDFIRPSPRLRTYLELKRSIFSKNEGLIVSKLCKLLMMSRDKVVSCDKLFEVKRTFGFPEDFLVNLVPRYPEYFRVVEGEGRSYLELVSWNAEFAKSVIELRAEEESRKIGIAVRPAFHWQLPLGFLYKKPMREWVRDWIEMPYISPYEDSSKLHPASKEAEKRMIGVLHEFLSLSLYKRIPVDVVGKFCEDYNYSNAYVHAFTRHSGIFYVSKKCESRTVMLREAYKQGELIDCDPLLEIDEKFKEMLAEGNEQWTVTKRIRFEEREKKRYQKMLYRKETELDLDDNE